MLENLSDYISFGVLIALIVMMLYILFVISNQHHALDMKKREEAYLAYLDEADDDYTDSKGEEENDEY